MEYKLSPLNNKIIMVKDALEEDSDVDLPIKFFGDLATSEKLQAFRIICQDQQPEELHRLSIGDLIVVADYQPIGKFNGNDLFITDRKSVVAKLKKKDRETL